MGSSYGVWEAWASDEAVRHRGSSGGALTALHGWLLGSGRASTIASASIGSDPRRTVPVTITTKEAALAAAGSRYAPVGVLSNPTWRRAMRSPPSRARSRRSGRSGPPLATRRRRRRGADPPLVLLRRHAVAGCDRRAPREARGASRRAPLRSLVPRSRMARSIHRPRGGRRCVDELRGVVGRRPRARDALALQGVCGWRGGVGRRRRGRLLEGRRARLPGVHRGRGVERTHRAHRTRTRSGPRRRGCGARSSCGRSACRSSRTCNRSNGTVARRSSGASSEADSPAYPDPATGASGCGPWRWRTPA